MKSKQPHTQAKNSGAIIANQNDDLLQLNKEAMKASEAGEYATAEELYEKILVIDEERFGINHPFTACTLNSLGFVLHLAGNFAEAENHHKRALAIKDKEFGSDHVDVARCHLGLGLVYISIGCYAEAEEYVKRALTIYEKKHGSSHPDVARCLNSLALVYQTNGSSFDSILEVELHGLARQEDKELEDAIEAYERQQERELDDAIEAHERRQEQEFQDSIDAHERKQERELDDAIEAHERRQEQELQDSIDAHERKQERELDDAIEAHERRQEQELQDSIDAYERLQEREFEDAIEAHERLKEQELEDAIEAYERQQEEALENAINAFEKNNGLIFYKIDMNTIAEKCLRRSLAILEKAFGNDHPDIASTLDSLALVYLFKKQFMEAEDCLNRSLSIRRKILTEEHPDIAASFNNFALLFNATDRYEDAEAYNKRALVIREKVLGSVHPDLARSLINLSNIYEKKGQTVAAVFLRKRAINIIQKVRQNVSKIGKNILSSFDKTVGEYYDDTANVLIKAERYGEASFVMGILKEKEQFELLRRDRQTDIATRTISYNDAEAPIAARFDELGSTLSTLGKQEESLKQIKNRTPEQNQELSAIKEQLKKVNQEFSEFLDNLHEALPPREVTQIDQDSYKLINMTDADANTVAIFTVTAEESFHAVMVTPHGRKAFSSDHKATDIATKVLKFRELLKEPEDTAFLALSKELYDIIIRPMEEELLSGEYSTILWMLNGVLRLLPLAALHDGKQFVLEKFRNVCITTCSTIGQQPHESWNGLGMGVTLKHGDHSPLPAVKEELEGIISMDSATGIMPGDILLDEAFTRDAMESHLEEGYKAVHIASHFELNPANETMSYLLLGDGSTIRMDELRSIPRLFKGVDLVAFSACSTGLGTASTRGREVDGIGYLGEMQGAKTVMATLWPVEDKSTSMLMREFYRLREEGMTTAEALRQAQLCLLNGKFTSEEGHDFTHPYFWAPFILIGNGG